MTCWDCGHPIKEHEAFIAARDAIARQGSRPDIILTSMRTIERGHHHAFTLECSVGHAEDELLTTSRWRWLRRRLLRRQIGTRSREALGMRHTFGWPP